MDAIRKIFSINSYPGGSAFYSHVYLYANGV